MSDRRQYAYALTPVLLVLVVGPTLVTLLPSIVTVPPGPVRFVGVLPLVAGLAVAVWAVRTHAGAGTSASPATTPSALVADGPYAHTRNPIYLGTVLAVAGEAVLFASGVLAIYAGLLWMVYHAVVVYKEEPNLAEAIGREYETYRERVPRWF